MPLMNKLDVYPAFSVNLGVMLLFIHVFLIVIVAFTILPILKRYFTIKPLIMMLLTLSALMPFVGEICFIILSSMLYYSMRLRERIHFKETQYPTFINEKKFDWAKYRGASAIYQLTNEAIPDEKKLEALISINNETSGSINMINLSMLQNDNDELRLFAYGKLNHQENAIYEKIYILEKSLKTHTHHHQILHVYKALIYCFWDLLYLRLAHDDLQRLAIDKMQFYLKKAERHRPNDLGITILSGRLQLFLKNLPEAKKLFLNALKANAPDSKVLPYLAEIAFINRDYHEVKQYFSYSHYLSFIPQYNHVVPFWEKLK